MTREAIIYTDGSSDHERNGGWAAIVATPISIMELTGFEEDTTNNRMEMQAAINGLLTLDKPYNVLLVSDSAYLLNTIEHKWYTRWFEEDFRDELHNSINPQGSQRKKRPNLDLWYQMRDLIKFHNIICVKVKGHDGIYLNEEVDRLAVQARITKTGHTKIHKNGYSPT